MAYLSLVGSMQSLVHVSTALCRPSPGSASMSLLPCGSFRAPTKVGFAGQDQGGLWVEWAFLALLDELTRWYCPVAFSLTKVSSKADSGVYFLFSDSFLTFNTNITLKRPHLAREVVLKEQEKKRLAVQPRFSKDGSIIEWQFRFLCWLLLPTPVSYNNTNQPGGSPCDCHIHDSWQALGVTVASAWSVAKGVPLDRTREILLASVLPPLSYWTTVVNASLPASPPCPFYADSWCRCWKHCKLDVANALILLFMISQISTKLWAEQIPPASALPSLSLCLLAPLVYTFAASRLAHGGDYWSSGKGSICCGRNGSLLLACIATTLADLNHFFPALHLPQQ